MCSSDLSEKNYFYNDGTKYTNIVLISDYNKIAALYGNEQYNLNDDEYMVLCDFDQMINIRNEALKQKYKPLVVDGIRKIVQGYTTLEELNKKLLIY